MAASVSRVNVRISRSPMYLSELVKTEGKSMHSVLDRAVEAYRRQAFFVGLNADFVRLQADPVEWKAELEERREWDNCLLDGIDDETW